MNAHRHDRVSEPAIGASVPVLLLFQACALIVRSYTQIALQERGIPYTIAKDLSWTVVPAILGILLYPLLRQNWAGIQSLFRADSLTLRLLVVSIALGVTLRLANWGGLIANAAFQVFTPDDASPIQSALFSFGCPSPPALLISLSVSAVMTPAVEEIMNRGLILQRLLDKGRLPAILGSAVLFGLFHNPQMIGPATLIGVFLAVQFLNARTLWAPVIAHASYNALAVVDSQCLNLMWNPLNGTPATAVAGTLGSAVLVAALALATGLCRRGAYHRR